MDMPKRRKKPIARDGIESRSSVSKQKVEQSLGDKLKAAGIFEEIQNRNDPDAQRIAREPPCSRDSELKPDTGKANRDELSRAYLGVRRLEKRKNRRVRKPSESQGNVKTDDEPTVGRLAAEREITLRAAPDFEISWDRDGDVSASRRNATMDELCALFQHRFRPEAILDLHGTVARDLEMKVTQFVLSEYRRGIRRLLIVHGKGKHSDDGVGVLVDHLVKVLTRSRISRYVRGFHTAELEHGGSGALAVTLVS